MVPKQQLSIIACILEKHFVVFDIFLWMYKAQTEEAKHITWGVKPPCGTGSAPCLHVCTPMCLWGCML